MRESTSGKLTEYRRGSGSTIQNHLANFKRDSQGRLLSFDYRQGPKDDLFSRTELSYSPELVKRPKLVHRKRPEM